MSATAAILQNKTISVLVVGVRNKSRNRVLIYIGIRNYLDAGYWHDPEPARFERIRMRTKILCRGSLKFRDAKERCLGLTRISGGYGGRAAKVAAGGERVLLVVAVEGEGRMVVDGVWAEAAPACLDR